MKDHIGILEDGRKKTGNKMKQCLCNYMSEIDIYDNPLIMIIKMAVEVLMLVITITMIIVIIIEVSWSSGYVTRI